MPTLPRVVLGARALDSSIPAARYPGHTNPPGRASVPQCVAEQLGRRERRGRGAGEHEAPGRASIPRLARCSTSVDLGLGI